MNTDTGEIRGPLTAKEYTALEEEWAGKLEALTEAEAVTLREVPPAERVAALGDLRAKGRAGSRTPPKDTGKSRRRIAKASQRRNRPR